MFTFKQFLAEALKTAYHSTNDEGFESIELRGFRPQEKAFRLFPDTVSFTYGKNSYGGNRLIKASLELDDKRVLRLTMKTLWDIADKDEEITPVGLGKRWVQRAKDQGMQAIIMTGVPGIGTEIAVLDTDIIKNTSEVKK